MAKSDANGSPVPAYLFDAAWRNGNILFPKDRGLRAELRRALESYTHYGIMHRSQNEELKTELQARVAAIEAYDAVIRARKKL